MRWAEPHRIAGVLAALAALPVAAAGAQAPLPPTLSLDTAFNPPTGITRDGSAGTTTDNPNAVTVDGDRIYAVGESTNDVSIFARRTNGTPDTGFSEDGRLTMSLGSNRDAGVDIVVLPDHRLRVLALQTSPTNTSDTDVALIGLLPDGSPDPEFGGGDGRVSFPVGPRRDTPTRLSVDAAGRLAISGFAEDSANRENSFVALRAPDGGPVAEFDGDGTRILDRAGAGRDDRGMDVVFRPGGGLVAALQVGTNANTTVDDFVVALHAFNESGADDPAFSEDGDLVLEVGEPNSIPTALLLYADRLWLTGSTQVGQDTDGFLARVGLDGNGFESRRFDIRGDRIPATEAVASAGRDITVLPGTPPTLAVVGGTAYLSRTYWSALAFNNLDAPLDQAQPGEIVIPTDETGALVGVAPADGFLIATGTLRNQDTFDTSFGLAKLRVDAEKACDLALDVLEPRELIFAGADPGVRFRVTNAGTRACAGTVNTAAPYALRHGGGTGPIATPLLSPGVSFTTPAATLAYGGARRRTDVVSFTVTAAGDTNATNDRRAVGAVFNFCDVGLRAAGAAGLMPDEGSRLFEFDVRNTGTVACPRVRVATASGPSASSAPYRLAAGRSVTDELRVAASGGRPGRTVALRFRAAADGDVDGANNVATISPVVVGVGDTTARRPAGRRVSGRARAGRGPKALARRLAVRRVDVGIRRLGAGCRWLGSARTMRIRRVKVPRGGRCNRPVWLRARGTSRWSLRLARRLPRGRYVLYSRATIAAGFPEARFSARDRNLVRFTVR